MTGDVIGSQEIIEQATIPGHGHQDEIEKVKVDIRELDAEAAEFDERLAELRAELKRLRALSIDSPQLITRPTGVTVAEHWRSLDIRGRREFLLAAGC